MSSPEPSPFAKYRDQILSSDETGQWFRSVVLALWDGGADPVALSPIDNIEEEHFSIFVELIRQYRLNGENDEAFEQLARDITSARIDEEIRRERTQRLEMPSPPRSVLRLVRGGDDDANSLIHAV